MSAKTQKSKTAVWVCGILSGLAMGVAGVLAQINQPKPAVWVGWVSILLGCVGARTYVAYKHPSWKRKATVSAIVLVAGLAPAAWWLENRSTVPAPSIRVESQGDHSSNIVGNSGPVTIQDDSASQDKPPEKGPKPKGKDK